MTHDELIPFLLEKSPLFESFGRDSVAAIVEGSELRTFEGNESIIQCGEEGRFIGVLLDGHGEISVADNTGGRIVMSPLEVGDVFGEMSVLTGDRTVADVIAGNRCLVLMIPQDVVSSHVLVNARAILYLSKLLADRARAQAVDVTSSQLRARALAQSDDPYALSLKKEVHGKILSINAGLSQIRFGIYDTHDEALDVHGVVDCADCEAVHITMTAAGRTLRMLLGSGGCSARLTSRACTLQPIG